MAATLNPLAEPKGSKKLCEVCAAPAFSECQGCHVTYYCSREHQSLDFESIHRRLCEFYGPLRRVATTLGTTRERDHTKELQTQRKRHLIDIAIGEARRWCLLNHEDYAVPAAIQALRLAQDVYGPSSIQLLPSCLLLAQANIGLHKLAQAEDYLTKANWSVLKTPDVEDELLSELNRCYGRLYLAKGSIRKAIDHLAIDIYSAAKARGPEHPCVTGGLMLMADAFTRLKDIASAKAFYAKTVNIWASELEQIESFDESRTVEAEAQLSTVVEHADDESPSPELRARASLAWALVLLVTQRDSDNYNDRVSVARGLVAQAEKAGVPDEARSLHTAVAALL